MCPVGSECVDGTCIETDPCAGVTCTRGESCSEGLCVADAPGGDSTAGANFYIGNCRSCHGANASGGTGENAGPGIVGYPAAQLQAGVTGSAIHIHASLTLTADDYANVAAFLSP